MSDQILVLVNDYLNDVAAFIKALRKRIGDDNPLSSVRSGKIPKEGKIDDDNRVFTYSFHGRGCKVIVDDRVVDFDFGNNFRHDGFDFWRLLHYAKSRRNDFPKLAHESVIKEHFDELVNSNLIRQSGGHLDELYYLVKT